MTVSCSDFEFVRGVLHRRSAMALADGKEYLVEARLGALAQQRGLRSVGEVLHLMRAGDGATVDAVVEAMTINETSFFRDQHPWEALRDSVIPAVLSANGGRGLSMWSAAASTGQEPYSMALLLREHFPQLRNVRILASDLSSDVLERARRGVYSQLEVNRGLPARTLVKHFDRTGRDWQLHDDLRAMVTFRRINIAEPLRAVGSMDVVFLRNVLIYFDAAAKERVLSEIARVVRPGGYLFLGVAETAHGTHSPFERVQFGRTSVYRVSPPARARSGER